MTTRQRIAQELALKEERVSAWEEYGLVDKSHWEIPRTEDVEEWYI